MNKQLTIVIPTYNVEKYIEQCLSSFLVPEILPELEVLIINDGSTDRSAELAEEFVNRYPDTFRLINKENGGHGSAINRGIQEASGRYMKVVDSDDWVEGEALKALVTFLRSSQSDLVISRYYWVHEQTGKKELEFEEPFAGVEYGREYTFSEVSRKVFLKMHAFTVRTKLMRRIPPIDEHCYYVDMEYVLFPIPQVRTVTFLAEVVYLYRIGLPGQSMNMSRMQKNEINYDRVFNRLLAFYREQQEKGVPDYLLAYLEHVLGRMTATRMKIYLSFPFRWSIRSKMQKFDENLKRQYPKVYHAAIHQAVWLLRRSHYWLYPVEHLLFWIKERKK